MGAKKAAEVSTYLFEVLTSNPTGRHTVTRVRAASTSEAVASVEAGLPHGHTVIDVDVEGKGVGSRERVDHA